MKDIEFGNRLERLRKRLKLTQEAACKKIGVTYGSLQRHEGGHNPNPNNLKKYLDFYECDRTWLITGLGHPFSGQDEPYIIKNREKEFPHIWASQNLKTHIESSDDLYGQASVGLRAIFNSGDLVSIKAIQANIEAFRLSALREQQNQQYANEIIDLKKKCDILEKENKEFRKRLAALEEKHKPGDPHTTASSQKAAM